MQSKGLMAPSLFLIGVVAGQLEGAVANTRQTAWQCSHRLPDASVNVILGDQFLSRFGLHVVAAQHVDIVIVHNARGLFVRHGQGGDDGPLVRVGVIALRLHLRLGLLVDVQVAAPKHKQFVMGGTHHVPASWGQHGRHVLPLVADRVVALHVRGEVVAAVAAGDVDEAAVDSAGVGVVGHGHGGHQLPRVGGRVVALRCRQAPVLKLAAHRIDLVVEGTREEVGSLVEHGAHLKPGVKARVVAQHRVDGRLTVSALRGAAAQHVEKVVEHQHLHVAEGGGQGRHLLSVQQAVGRDLSLKHQDLVMQTWVGVDLPPTHADQAGDVGPEPGGGGGDQGLGVRHHMVIESRQHHLPQLRVRHHQIDTLHMVDKISRADEREADEAHEGGGVVSHAAPLP